MNAKAISYAENQLGVNEVYESALQAQSNFVDVCVMLGTHRERRRALDERITTREMEVAEAEWAKHPDMAVTRMEKHLRAALIKDSVLQDLRSSLVETLNNIDTHEAEKANCVAMQSMYAARMIELGGYFNYLAAIKQAELHEKQREAGATT